MTDEMPQVDTNDRTSLIAWLIWNDPNGCYADDECTEELGSTATLETLQALYRQQTLTCASCCELFDDGEPEMPRPDPSYPSRTLLYHASCAAAYDQKHNG
jgi:hypothetical protein